MEPEHNRRAMDKSDIVGRITHIESEIGDLNAGLRAHILTEDNDRKQMAVAIERLSVVAERQDSTLERVANTLDVVAQHTVRVDALEKWQDRTDEKLDEASDKVRFIYWVVPIAASLAIGAWTVLTHFKVI